jgi:hypothetical protein
VGHFASHIIERFFYNSAVKWFAGQLVSVQIKSGQQRIIIKHLFKMRHQPYGIYRVTVKTTAQLVVHATQCHFVQAELNHIEVSRFFAAVIRA